jgi:hypothetical protein
MGVIMSPRQGTETREHEQSRNDDAARVLLFAAEQAQAARSGEAATEPQPLDDELKQRMSEKLEGIYQAYYQQASSSPAAPETLLDRQVATRGQFFDVLERYVTTKAVYGLAAEGQEQAGVVLPPGINVEAVRQEADRVRGELAQLYEPLMTKARERNVSGIGRAEGVHETVHGEGTVPSDVMNYVNGDLAEELKIAVVDGNTGYINQVRATLQEMRIEPFLREQF